MAYKYLITKEVDGYHFGLYPNNNNRQPMGLSGSYKTSGDAHRGMEQFQTLLHQNSNLFTVTEAEGKYYFTLKTDAVTFRRTMGYEQRSSARRGIQRIYTNVDAELAFIE